ncbi:MAG: ABC transporter permease subunit [Spirochaetaceae bacterium]|nr:MAG: ABC transporter permease subunit [Spirochaetaceae bacterium]
MSRALLISLYVLAVDVPLLLVLGTSLGWLFARGKFFGREILLILVLLPIALPPSVLGLYLLLFFGQLPFLRPLRLLFSFPGAALAALISSLPIMVQSTRAGFSAVPWHLEEAARTLGDGDWRVFWRVSLPLSRRSLVAGIALAAARALGDFGLTLMIAGNIPGRTQTLPLYIYSQIEALEFGMANLAALLLVAVGIASLALVKRMERGRHERFL